MGLVYRRIFLTLWPPLISLAEDIFPE